MGGDNSIGLGYKFKKLQHQLSKDLNLNPIQQQFLLNWFDHHFLLLGSQYNISEHVLDLYSSLDITEIKLHHKKSCGSKMGIEIINNCSTETEYEEGYCNRTIFETVVFKGKE
jgi:hypothetical protein